ISKNSVAYIVDADGYIVATSGQELPEKIVNGVAERMRAVDMKTPLIGETFRKVANVKISSAQTKTIEINNDTIDVAISPLGNRQGLNWTSV
ncbi:hypothetical protein ABTK05_19950, partial [Acinetobacter baumannii]